MRGKRVRKVELQLLRQGPPHNQLLSPLTDYLALCGDHPNTTLNFPIEHQALKVRLHALRYRDSEETRKIQLQESASLVAGMLADVPGLISELGHRDSSAEALVHLSIATTASELSLVPFELAHSPPGFPGSGGPLSLQTEFPVSITRRSRKVRFESLKWNREPRILFIASDAGGSIPLQSHYLMLRQIVEPWIQHDYGKQLSPTELHQDELHRHLVLVENANVRSIQEHMHEAIETDRPFTHIHVLAHGCELPNQDESYGVALHHPKGNGVDAVDGQRLGQLFTGKLVEEHFEIANNKDVRPNVVTLMVCDSGKQGAQVERPGASVAFNIHEAGIPLVVGSQFPLTKSGSTVLTGSLYRQLLDGVDPRICLWEARRELFSQSAEKYQSTSAGRHDWASIVAFAAFPNNIERESRKLEREQRHRRMDARLHAGDRFLESVANRPWCIEDPRIEIARELPEEVEAEVHRFDKFVDQSQKNGREHHIDLLGISASANKRAAELLHFHQKHYNIQVEDPNQRKNDDIWLKFIWSSYRRYLQVSRRDANQTWAFVQALFLQRYISFYSKADRISAASKEAEVSQDTMYDDWFRTKYLCFHKDENDARSRKQLIWNLTNKIELGLLRTLIPAFDKKSTTRDSLRSEFGADVMLDWLREIDRHSLTPESGVHFAVYASRRQLLRYRRFADMMYVEPDIEKTYKHRSNRSEQAQDGYKLLAELRGEFGEMFQQIEDHIKEQIEIGEVE